MRDAVAVVQEQLEAYNARDLDRFAATYSDDIRIWRMPATEPSIAGQAQLREIYAKRFTSAGLHATIVNRIALGDKVIDHERVAGIEAGPIEAVAVYQVVGGLIAKVWFYYPADKPFPVPKS
jgi:hypothetical protein